MKRLILLLVNLLAILGIILFVPPVSAAIIVLLIAAIALFCHLFTKAVIKPSRSFSYRILAVYLPLVVSYILLLTWQRIFDFLFIVYALVIFVILESCLRYV